eukprot:s3038_g7.t1
MSVALLSLAILAETQNLEAQLVPGQLFLWLPPSSIASLFFLMSLPGLADEAEKVAMMLGRKAKAEKVAMMLGRKAEEKRVAKRNDPKSNQGRKTGQQKAEKAATRIRLGYRVAGAATELSGSKTRRARMWARCQEAEKVAMILGRKAKAGQQGGKGSDRAIRQQDKEGHACRRAGKRRNDRPREEKRSGRATEAEKAATRIRVGNRVAGAIRQEDKEGTDVGMLTRGEQPAGARVAAVGYPTDLFCRFIFPDVFVWLAEEAEKVAMMLGRKRHGSIGSGGSIHAAEREAITAENDRPREEKRSNVRPGLEDKAAESREGSNTDKAGQQGGRGSE